MRITDVRTVLLTGPCTDDPWLSVFKQSRSAAFCEVETDHGTIGVGETYAGYFFPESVPLMVSYVREILINAEAFEPEISTSLSSPGGCAPAASTGPGPGSARPPSPVWRLPCGT